MLSIMFYPVACTERIFLDIQRQTTGLYDALVAFVIQVLQFMGVDIEIHGNFSLSVTLIHVNAKQVSTSIIVDNAQNHFI
jgi:hypothetical protein